MRKLSLARSLVDAPGGLGIRGNLLIYCSGRTFPNRDFSQSASAVPPQCPPKLDRMTAAERRASLGLASIFGLRMLGMFIILPVFALYAEQLPGGADHTLIGIALGAYGLTQAICRFRSAGCPTAGGASPSFTSAC